ncbi:MAG: IS1096 element passenger TnpR family protein [Bacteroidales bacterium]
MIYKFRMISGDERAFLREYEVYSDCTFLDFHKFIQNDLDFDANQLASFFLTDEQWNKGMELTLIDMENDAGPAAIPMDSVKVKELLKKKKERLLYVFDIFSDRCFFIELADIFEPKENVQYPRCAASVGSAPDQIIVEDISMEDLADNDDDFDEIINDIGFSETDIDPEDL